MNFDQANAAPLSALDISPKPRLHLVQMFQLGLFQMGLGMMSLLTLGVLNRVMIKELAIPATIAAGVIAVHQFMSPARLWFGQRSDSRPIGGYHRTGYIWLGSAGFAVSAFLAVQVMWQLGDSVAAQGWTLTSQLWAVALGGVFGLYGLALSSGSTPFAALLVDVSEEEDRSKLISIVWSMLMVGIVIGAITC
jgi:MFS transporter, BCD family, chlorophyll transporter